MFEGDTSIIESGDDDSNPVLALVDQYCDSDSTEPLDLPESLTAKDRFAIHEYAEERGLGHESIGTGSGRHVQLSKPSVRSS